MTKTTKATGESGSLNDATTKMYEQSITPFSESPEITHLFKTLAEIKQMLVDGDCWQGSVKNFKSFDKKAPEFLVLVYDKEMKENIFVPSTYEQIRRMRP